MRTLLQFLSFLGLFCCCCYLTVLEVSGCLGAFVVLFWFCWGLLGFFSIQDEKWTLMSDFLET